MRERRGRLFLYCVSSMLKAVLIGIYFTFRVLIGIYRDLLLLEFVKNMERERTYFWGGAFMYERKDCE